MSCQLFYDRNKIADAIGALLGLKLGYELFDGVQDGEFGMICGDPESHEPEIEIHLPSNQRMAFRAMLEVSARGVLPKLCVEIWDNDECVYSNDSAEAIGK